MHCDQTVFCNLLNFLLFHGKCSNCSHITKGFISNCCCFGYLQENQYFQAIHTIIHLASECITPWCCGFLLTLKVWQSFAFHHFYHLCSTQCFWHVTFRRVWKLRNGLFLFVLTTKWIKTQTDHNGSQNSSLQRVFLPITTVCFLFESFTCACTFLDNERSIAPSSVPAPIMLGITTSIRPVSLGEIRKRETTHPATWDRKNHRDLDLWPHKITTW